MSEFDSVENYDETEELMQEEIANLSDKVGSLAAQLEAKEKALQDAMNARASAETRSAILKDEVSDLMAEIAKVKKQAKPIVEFVFGSYNKWRHREGGRPTLNEAYEFFKDYIKGSET